MQIKNFENVSYRFRLFDTSDQPVNGMLVSLQYFDANKQVWKEFYRGTVTNGSFSFDERIANGLASEFIKDNIIPELRIVAVNAVYPFNKTQVLAQVYQLTLTTTTPSMIAFDFGKSFLVEKDVLLRFDVFADFILITSPISLVNEQQNLHTIQQLQTDLAAAQALNTQLTAENAAAQTQISSLTLEVQAKDETISSLNTQLVTALSESEEKSLEIGHLQVLKSNLEMTIAELQRQVDELSRQINFDDRPVAVNTLYSNLVRELDISAQNNQDSDYKLANISLKLKALISTDEDGVNAQLFGLSNMNLLNGNAISELTFDIEQTQKPARVTDTIPNLLGLTETAVRRILSSLGLRLNPVFQNNRKVVNGDSFKQSPAEGSPIVQEEPVTVIFSKHE